MKNDALSATLTALADPTRRAILGRLAAGEATVTELAEPFAMSLPAVSRHLKVLERAQLITRGRDAQWRPCRLRAAPLRDVADWLAPYQEFWEVRLGRLGAYLEGTESGDVRGGRAGGGGGGARTMSKGVGPDRRREGGGAQ